MTVYSGSCLNNFLKWGMMIPLAGNTIALEMKLCFKGQAL
jgi:hypothetical protein